MANGMANYRPARGLSLAPISAKLSSILLGLFARHQLKIGHLCLCCRRVVALALPLMKPLDHCSNAQVLNQADRVVGAQIKVSIIITFICCLIELGSVRASAGLSACGYCSRRRGRRCCSRSGRSQLLLLLLTLAIVVPLRGLLMLLALAGVLAVLGAIGRAWIIGFGGRKSVRAATAAAAATLIGLLIEICLRAARRLGVATC